MSEIKYQIVRADDKTIIELIAGWYLSEWKIAAETTISKTFKISD